MSIISELIIDSEKSGAIEELEKLKNEIEDTGAYEQEVNGKTEFLKGINYCLSVIDKHKAEWSDKE